NRSVPRTPPPAGGRRANGAGHRPPPRTIPTSTSTGRTCTTSPTRPTPPAAGWTPSWRRSPAPSSSSDPVHPSLLHPPRFAMSPQSSDQAPDPRSGADLTRAGIHPDDVLDASDDDYVDIDTSPGDPLGALLGGAGGAGGLDLGALMEQA